MTSLQREAIDAIIRQWAKGECLYGVGESPPLRLFYGCKAIICILLGWRRCLWAQDPVGVAMIGFCSGSNCVVGDWADWTEVAVGYGFTKKWHYDIYTTGYP